MKVIPNFTEPCTCGYDLSEINIEKVWRIITWKCPKCNRVLASTCVSDSPVADVYAIKTLYSHMNKQLRKEKNMPARLTRFVFIENKKRILWKDIVKRNRKWQEKTPTQRKPF